MITLDCTVPPRIRYTSFESLAMPFHNPPASELGSLTLNKVIPALTLVKDSVVGLGVPGLEAAVGGTLRVFQMVQVRSNDYRTSWNFNL